MKNVHRDHPLYTVDGLGSYIGDNTKWLEFFDASNKWYIKATPDKGKARGWMRLSSNPPSKPELCKAVCEVWDGSKWTSQSSVSLVTAKQRREEDKKLGAERRKESVPVDVRGNDLAPRLACDTAKVPSYTRIYLFISYSSRTLVNSAYARTLQELKGHLRLRSTGHMR